MGRGERGSDAAAMAAPSVPPATAELAAAAVAAARHHLFRLERTYHVGTFRLKADRPFSYEGRGISVSLDPESWRSIARLGDAPTWCLARPGGTFLDRHAFMRGRRRAAALEWASAAGYVALAETWVIRRYDEELDDVRITYYPNRKDAEDDREESERILRRMRHCVTPAGAARFGDDGSGWHHGLAEDVAVVLMVEDLLPDIDGVWWWDQDDPAAYSAPRGVIVPNAVARWARRKLQPGEDPADDAAAED